MRKSKWTIPAIIGGILCLAILCPAQPQETIRLDTERTEFHKLLKENPNYFGTFPESKMPLVKPIKSSVKYEELLCAGLFPEESLLQAVIEVKLPYGFKGGLCGKGSTEYVAFYVDSGGGFTSVGEAASVNVHDLASVRAGHVFYAVKKGFAPELLPCTTPQIIRLRAILSWEKPPTGPGFVPVWGNVIERWIQVRPKKRPIIFYDMFDLKKMLGNPDLTTLSPEISVNALDEAENAPVMIMGGKKEVMKYLEEFAAEEDKPITGAGVEPERSNFKRLIKENVNYFGSLTTNRDPNQVKAAIAKLPKASIAAVLKPGIDWSKLVPVSPIIGNATYEELKCVGLYPEEDLLEAVIEVKKPVGYGGELCRNGSLEYVTFYIDWGDGAFDQVGTARVRVHDIPGTGPGRVLHYAVKLTIKDIADRLKECEEENVVKVRAILSWNHNPSVWGPDYVPAWGNVLTRAVQIRPSSGSACRIDSVNTMAMVHINQSGASRGLGINFDDITFPYTYDRPFGGYIAVKGVVNVAGCQYYRFRYRPEGAADWISITAPRYTPNPTGWWPFTLTRTPDENGWFGIAQYTTDHDYYDLTALAYWPTHSLADGRYEMRLEVADAAHVVRGSQEIILHLDNTAPAFYKFHDAPATFPAYGVAVKNNAGDYMKCQEFNKADEVQIFGNFMDEHFNNFRLEVFGGNIAGYQVCGQGLYNANSASGKVEVRDFPNPGFILSAALSPNIVADGTLHHGDTTSGAQIGKVLMNNVPQEPQVRCAYGVMLYVWDKAIVGGLSGYMFSTSSHGNHSYVTFMWWKLP